jgi:hypothetical protein
MLSFDKLRACPVLDTGTNGSLLIAFVVSLSNHALVRLHQNFPRLGARMGLAAIIAPNTLTGADFRGFSPGTPRQCLRFKLQFEPRSHE